MRQRAFNNDRFEAWAILFYTSPGLDIASQRTRGDISPSETVMIEKIRERYISQKYLDNFDRKESVLHGCDMDEADKLVGSLPRGSYLWVHGPMEELLWPCAAVDSMGAMTMVILPNLGEFYATVACSQSPFGQHNLYFADVEKFGLRWGRFSLEVGRDPKSGTGQAGGVRPVRVEIAPSTIGVPHVRRRRVSVMP